MAKYVKISTLNLTAPPLRELPFTGDMERLVENMIAHLQENLNKVLPDKPDIILLPECCDCYGSHSPEQVQAYYRYRGDRIRDYLCGVAKEHHCYIAYSAVRCVPEDPEYPFRNSTQILGRNGEIVGVYDKNHLMPFECDGRKMAYGTEIPVMELDFGRVGCAICFDLNFDELMYRYAKKRPELILFCSQYHGGIQQKIWAYKCRAFFAGAIWHNQSPVLNPYGEVVASSTNYCGYATARVNLDYALVHLDDQNSKLDAAKEKYGPLLQIHDPGNVGSMMLSYEAADQTVQDILKEFDMITVDAYFDNCRNHRNAHI